MSQTPPANPPRDYPSWHDWANRTTAILAVLAALSSGRWGASNLAAILEQGKVNDTWAYFQSDSIKAHSARQAAELTKALIIVQGASPTTQPGSVEVPQSKALPDAALVTLVNQFEKEEKAEIAKKDRQQRDAVHFQHTRDSMVERGFWFELSFAALQLGVILCTIATGAKKQWAWLSGIALGAMGLVVLANGFHPVVHAPEGGIAARARTWAICRATSNGQ